MKLFIMKNISIFVYIRKLVTTSYYFTSCKKHRKEFQVLVLVSEKTLLAFYSSWKHLAKYSFNYSNTNFNYSTPLLNYFPNVSNFILAHNYYGIFMHLEDQFVDLISKVV